MACVLGSQTVEESLKGLVREQRCLIDRHRHRRGAMLIGRRVVIETDGDVGGIDHRREDYQMSESAHRHPSTHPGDVWPMQQSTQCRTWLTPHSPRSRISL